MPLSGVTEAGEAPLAVVGAAPRSGLFAFDKFSSAPFIMDAVRNDVSANSAAGDTSRRIFLMPRGKCTVRLAAATGCVAIDLTVGGIRRQLPFRAGQPPSILANGTIEATRLALESFGVGSTQFGSPRVGNLMAHLRSNITVRIKRTALGLGAPVGLETVALLARGTAAGPPLSLPDHGGGRADRTPKRRCGAWSPISTSSAPCLRTRPELGLDHLPRHRGDGGPGRGQRSRSRASWIDLSPETDQWGMRRAYVNLVATANDRQFWQAMDKAAFDLALGCRRRPREYPVLECSGQPVGQRGTQPDANGGGFWQDRIGTTHHEAGTLFMGDPGRIDHRYDGKFHGKRTPTSQDPALFPTLGSANPSLTALSLARRTANAIIASMETAVAQALRRFR